MRTAWTARVIAAHVAVVVSFLGQGCTSTYEQTAEPAVVPMPPREVEPIEQAVQTPGPVAPAETMAPEIRVREPQPTTVYVVRKGDTLSQVAHRYGLSIADIVALTDITDPNKIRIGQKLTLPGEIDLGAASPMTPAHAPRITLPEGGTEYVVQRGDCLSVIAKKFGVTTKSLRAANHLSGDTIFVDQKLAIPAGGSPVSVPVAPVAPTTPDTSTPPVIDETPELGGAPVAAPPSSSMGEPAVPTVETTTQRRLHTVQPGQSLLGIASEWNVSIEALRAANPWLGDGTPQEGDQLVIPAPEE